VNIQHVTMVLMLTAGCVGCGPTIPDYVGPRVSYKGSTFIQASWAQQPVQAAYESCMYEIWQPPIGFKNLTSCMKAKGFEEVFN
jgi:hypothetical protein